MKSIAEFAAAWTDTPEFHRSLHDRFSALVDADSGLKAHRDYIEAGDWGFGERSFHWLWKMLVEEMPPEFSFLEIGVHRGQSLSVVGMLAMRTNRSAHIYGLSPYDGRDGYSDQENPHDYHQDVAHLMQMFCSPPEGGESQVSFYPIDGDSTSKPVAARVRDQSPFDIVYIDGSHRYADVQRDILYYCPMVRKGGYLLMDDSATGLSMPSSLFPGYETVSMATDELLPPKTPNPAWQHIGNVVHLRVWKRLPANFVS